MSVSPAAVEAVRPTGPHAVGVTQRDDALIFYPARTSGAPWAAATSDARRQGLTRRFGGGAAEALSAARTTAKEDAEATPGRFPLLIFQPGAGVGSLEYRLLLEDLGSRGFVVLALHAQTSPQASEARYAEAAREFLEALTASRDGGDPGLAIADTSRPVFIGHSLGGAAAVIALSEAPGGVAVNLDGDLMRAPRLGDRSSVLYLIGRNPAESDASRARRAGVWREAAGQADAVALQIGDMGHFDFSDVALLKANVPENRRPGRFGPIDGAEAQALTADLVGAFLESRVRGTADVWRTALSRRDRATPPTTW